MLFTHREKSHEANDDRTSVTGRRSGPDSKVQESCPGSVQTQPQFWLTEATCCSDFLTAAGHVLLTFWLRDTTLSLGPL